MKVYRYALIHIIHNVNKERKKEPKKKETTTTGVYQIKKYQNLVLTMGSSSMNNKIKELIGLYIIFAICIGFSIGIALSVFLNFQLILLIFSFGSVIFALFFKKIKISKVDAEVFGEQNEKEIIDE